MIEFGIAVCDTEQLNTIVNLLKKYLHCPPHYNNQFDGAEWYLPLVHFKVNLVSKFRGYKFDILYYDKRIEQDIVNEILYPCCPYGRPRELTRLLDILKR